MKRFILGALLFMACSSYEVIKPSPVYSSYVEIAAPLGDEVINEGIVDIYAGIDLEGLISYINKRAIECCAQLGIPLPDKVIIYLWRGQLTEFPDGSKAWIEGFYSNKRITLYTRDGLCRPFSFKEVIHNFYHELLHHDDFIKGKIAPQEHNDLFDKRIKELGWE